MPPKPAKPAGFGKKQSNKEWSKKVQFYGLLAVVGVVVGLIFIHAEYEAAADRSWAAVYERRCEACQTMVTSGVLTRSMIYQQQKKQMQEERAAILEANPDAELPAEEEPQVGAVHVLRYMCNDQQIDQLLQNNRFTFDNGYSTVEDPEFGASLKKLCFFAMGNSTSKAVFKRMLEAPMKPVQKPTLVSLSKMHFEGVCVKATSMCTAEELQQGIMVDPQAEDPAPAEEAPAATGAGDTAAEPPAGETKYTEL
jgi:hypothetical protein